MEDSDKGEAAGDGLEPHLAAPEDTQPATDEQERAAQLEALSGESSLDQFKRSKFFVLRPGTLNQAIKDVEAFIDKKADSGILGIWLVAEVDHWNNEKERLIAITENFLLVFKYDFVLLICERIQKIPLNIIDRITKGSFAFPKHSLLQREGEGLRLFWDRMREPSFVSRWNPFTTELPFITFTSHPVRSMSNALSALCNIENFCERLKDAAQRAHAMSPVPGKANGVLVLNQSIPIEAYVGLMSVLGNQNRLGYCVARGNLSL